MPELKLNAVGEAISRADNLMCCNYCHCNGEPDSGFHVPLPLSPEDETIFKAHLLDLHGINVDKEQADGA